MTIEYYCYAYDEQKYNDMRSSDVTYESEILFVVRCLRLQKKGPKKK